MNAYHAQIESACRAALVSGPARYLWFGREIAINPFTSAERRAMASVVHREYLLASLEQTLYTNFYCQGIAVPARRHPGVGSPAEAARFVEQLSAANAGAGCWEDGWVVRRASYDDEAAVLQAREGELAVHARPGEYRAPLDGQPREGARVRLHLPHGYLGLAPGFYTAAGDAPVRQGLPRPVLRLYWHVTPRGAVRLVASATTAMNAAGIPFRLKVLDCPAAYTRCDAAVLYIYDYEWAALATMLARLHAEVAHELMPEVPAFTKALAPGLGLAEDPPGGESFGLHRCHLVADSLIRAHEVGDSATDARVRAVEARLAENGIRLEAPYVNPGATDVYVLSISAAAAVGRRVGAAPSRRAHSAADRAAWWDVAAGIGRQLAREALWYRGRCNWVGAIPEDTTTQRSAHTMPAGATLARGALGPELYGGTSGIALFMATLAAATNDANVGRTAAGAVRHALDQADSVPTEVRLGLYAGWSGMALAAVRVGLALEREDLLRGGVDLVRRLVRFSHARTRAGAARQHDLISGSAGAIVALIALAGQLDDPALLEPAAEMCRDLMLAARVRDGVCSWTAPDHPRQRHLTGLAHGAAGIGWAVLELWAATNEPDYLRTAEMAFGYERACFDAAAGFWPDFRDVPEARSRAQWTSHRVAMPYAVAWCHGAPGIALSRLRACALRGGSVYRNEARTALDTTARVVRSTLASRVDDFSVCHGLAGCADILLEGRRTLGPERARDATLAEEVAAHGMAAFAAPDTAWPCGFDGGQAPGLMRGLAGIGYFYLRVADPQTPSILLPLRPLERAPVPSRAAP